jgi:hypothetical protein
MEAAAAYVALVVVAQIAMRRFTGLRGLQIASCLSVSLPLYLFFAFLVGVRLHEPTWSAMSPVERHWSWGFANACVLSVVLIWFSYSRLRRRLLPDKPEPKL